MNSVLIHIEKDNKYLMLHRNKKQNDINKDKWIGIGGKFEKGESPEECAYREAFEETGLKLKELKLCGIVTFVSDENYVEYMFVYKSTSFEGVLKQCDEGTLEWIDKQAVYSLNLWEGDKIFLRLLEEDAPFFSLKLVYEKNKLTLAVLNGEKLKENIAVSACLLGEKCRYDGASKPVELNLENYNIIPVCPETAGGLSVPRPAAEINGGRVINSSGVDVTAQYDTGAEAVLQKCIKFGCKKAILKENSPACGVNFIYDGTFSKRKISGMGVCAKLLKKNGIEVLSEKDAE